MSGSQWTPSFFNIDTQQQQFYQSPQLSSCTIIQQQQPKIIQQARLIAGWVDPQTPSVWSGEGPCVQPTAPPIIQQQQPIIIHPSIQQHPPNYPTIPPIIQPHPMIQPPSIFHHHPTIPTSIQQPQFCQSPKYFTVDAQFRAGVVSGAGVGERPVWANGVGAGDYRQDNVPFGAPQTAWGAVRPRSPAVSGDRHFPFRNEDHLKKQGGDRFDGSFSTVPIKRLPVPSNEVQSGEDQNRVGQTHHSHAQKASVVSDPVVQQLVDLDVKLGS